MMCRDLLSVGEQQLVVLCKGGFCLGWKVAMASRIPFNSENL